LGQIVGTGGPGGFLDNNGTITPIDVPGSFGTTPNGINDAGQIVGTYTDSNGVQYSFLYDPAPGPIPGAGLLSYLALGLLGLSSVGWKRFRQGPA